MLRQPLVLLVLLWGFALVHAAAQPASEPTAMAQAVAAIKLKPKWQGIEIAAEKPKNYRLELNYKPSSSAIGQAEVSADLKEVARVVLGELVKQGNTPTQTRSMYLYTPTRSRDGERRARLWSGRLVASGTTTTAISCNSTRQKADSPSSSGSRLPLSLLQPRHDRAKPAVLRLRRGSFWHDA